MELFIAGRDAYYEFEINSLGTIYEVFFIWEGAYETAGYAKIPEFARPDGRALPPRDGDVWRDLHVRPEDLHRDQDESELQLALGDRLQGQSRDCAVST